MAVQYDPKVDYSDLIAQEAAKGVNANRNLLAQYEQQRNAKIADQNLGYAQTNIYTNGSGNVTGSTAPNVTDVGVGSIVSMGKPGGYYTATSQADYINELYDASLKAQQAALESAYNANLAAYDQQASKIPAVYQAAKNQTASSAEIARQGLNERFAASGLNTGAQGQAALAMSTATQGNLSSLDAQRAQAVADIEAERAQTMAQYQSAVAEAIAKNEMQRAQALYEEAMRVDNSYREETQYFLQKSAGSSSSSSSGGGGGGGAYTSGGTTGTGATGNTEATDDTPVKRPVGDDTPAVGTAANANRIYTSLFAVPSTSGINKSAVIDSAVSNGSITREQGAEIKQKLGIMATSSGLSLNAASILQQITNPIANLTAQDKINRINSSLSNGRITSAEAEYLLYALGY